MEESRAYPIGQQNFRELRENGCIYVDKTSFVEKIANNGSQYWFLARPRRFGKSLFLSTLEYFFKGERELFHGLFINGTNWNWQAYPVLRLDLNVDKYKKKGLLDKVLDNYFSKWEQLYGVEEVAETYSLRLGNIIEAAHKKTGCKVVILVDEYDKPLVGNLDNDENFEHYREQLASVYSNFKSSAEHIKLVFLTGVSRFSKLSVFSDLNNLRDITFSEDFADICGITEPELHQYFKGGIDSLAANYGTTYDEMCIMLKEYYDGYRFAKKGSDIYNPWSLLGALADKSISNYWSRTGDPSIVVEPLKHLDVDLERTLNSRFRFRTLEGMDLKNADPTALLYQAGYLTIKHYDFRTDTVSLGVPNKEVKEALFEGLLPLYIKVKRGEPLRVVFDIVEDLREGLPEKLVKDLDIFFSGIPYDMKMDNENNLHNAIYILLTLIGTETETEVRTSNGRIDLVIKTPDYIYIIELKFDKSSQEAMDQIKEKEYDLPYRNDGRRLFLIGINFSSQTRRLDPPIIE
ncbi:MAG: ATP-binding protein [Muribaculaceae bacterium]|nr:ATP-binding protein [Muribaculaceae bacterium]